MATNLQGKFNEAIHRPVAVNFRGGNVDIKLANGRTLSTPLARHPWLAKATPSQLKNYELGYSSVWWPDLDDGLDIEWLLMQPAEKTRRQTTGVQTTSSHSVDYHVVPYAGKWAVKGAGNERVSTVHDTQKQAIDAARKVLRNKRGELTIHDQKGRIRNRESFGKPKSPTSKS